MKHPTLDPRHDVVLLLPEAPSADAAGFLLRQDSSRQLRSCVVVAVGPGRWSDFRGERVPPSVQVGERILVSAKAGIEVPHGEHTYLAVVDAEILFIDRR